MRIVCLLMALAACNRAGLDSDCTGGNCTADLSQTTPSPADDPCGNQDPTTGAYGCAYLVGDCPTVGLSCYCWENGTMVCQENHQWELISDFGCPYFAGQNGQSFEGLGCIGASDQCGACSCNHSTEIYECADGGA